MTDVMVSGCSGGPDAPDSCYADDAWPMAILCTAAAARCPLRTAPSIVAGKPVSVQSPARNSPGTDVTGAGRGGPPGAIENDARGSRTTTDRTHRAAAAAGSNRASSRVAVAARVALSSATRSPAPLETMDRWPAAEPKMALLSNAQWIGLPTKPTKPSIGGVKTGRSNHRFTVTIGDEAMRAALSHVAVSAAGLPSGHKPAKACQGTALTTTRVSTVSLPARTRWTSPWASSSTDAVAFSLTWPPPASI